jgi:hypothetical protein
MNINILGVDCEIEYDYVPADKSVGVHEYIEITAVTACKGKIDLLEWFDGLQYGAIEHVQDRVLERHLDTLKERDKDE